MPLILAIEPDRRQASHLTAMVRGRLHAEFVIGDSAQRALEALGSRVPDLVLTTALLSPKDEAALGDRLRALDGAAAHVQTLTIPVLATPGRGRRAAKPAGMLSALLRDKGDDGPAEGCDPAVFAEQCKEYLERAAHERAQAVDRLEPHIEPRAAAAPAEPVVTLEPIVPPEPIVPVRVRYARMNDDDPPSSLMAAVAAFAEDEPFVDAADSTDAVQEPETPSTVEDDEELTAHYQFVDVDLSSMLDDPNRVRTAEARDAGDDEDEPALEVYEIDSTILDPSDVGGSQPAMAASADEPAGTVDETPAMEAAATVDEAAATVSEVGLYTPLPRPEVRTWPILEGLTTGALTADTIAEIKVQAPEPVAVRETEDVAEWSDIIEALRRDARPAPVMRDQPTQGEPIDAAGGEAVAAGPSPSEPEPASPDAPNGNGRRRRRKSPVQDEWGFFDPDRAGFSALIAKLEEITEDDAATPQRT